jgi:hypothetical protein
MIAIVFDVFEDGEGGNNIIKKSFIAHLSWILTSLSSPLALLILLFILPVFVTIFMLAFSYFYNPTHILETEDDVSKISKIMMTFHNFIIFLFSSIILLGFCLIIYQWFVKAYK